MTQRRLQSFSWLYLHTYYVPGTVLGADGREALVCVPGSPELACSRRSIHVTRRKGAAAQSASGEVAHVWLWPGRPWSSFHLLLWKWMLRGGRGASVTLTSSKIPHHHRPEVTGSSSNAKLGNRTWSSGAWSPHPTAACAVVSPSSIFYKGQLRDALAHFADKP